MNSSFELKTFHTDKSNYNPRYIGNIANYKERLVRF